MDVLRTPDSRFARLSAYPYPERLVAVGDDLRAACLVEGAHDGRPVLLLHGGPTWSFLWRRVMPMLLEAHCRLVVPDLLGMGRSDKPAITGQGDADLGLERQLGALVTLCGALDIKGAVLVFHGMSGLLGLKLLAAAGERFTSAVGVCPLFDRGAPEVAALCRRLREDDPVDVSELVAEGCAEAQGEAARTGYDAPFPEPVHLAAIRALPDLLASDATSWPAEIGPVRVPLLAVSGAKDLLAGADGAWLDQLAPLDDETPILRRRITLAGAGHYAPEDRGAELALALLPFLGRDW